MATRDEVVESAISDVERVLDFGERFTRACPGDIKPRTHQIIRMAELVEGALGEEYRTRGTRRAVIADATSAGKTLTAVGIKALRDQRSGSNGKALVIAPEQAIREAWKPDRINEYCRSMGLPLQDVRFLERNSMEKAFEGDMIFVNYHKFGYLPDINANPYRQAVLDHAHLLREVIFDESQNLKTITANRTCALIDVVERTRGLPALIMSAAPIPNKLKDAGFLLYLLDPIAYKKYATLDFQYNMDPDAIRNAILTHSWFHLSRDDVGQMFGLPSIEGENTPTHIPLDDRVADAYVNVWAQRMDSGAKILQLRRTLLTAKVPYIIQTVREGKEKDARTQFSIFTFLKDGFITENGGQEGSLVRELKRMGLRVGIISGDTERVAERLQVAEEFRDGNIDVLLSTVQTAGEAISLVTYDRPCVALLADPPIAPGEYDQIVGRHYRHGLRAPLRVLELVTRSEYLNQRMRERKPEIEQHARFRRNWQPSTIEEDRFTLRNQKRRLYQERVVRGLRLEGTWEIIADIGDDETTEVGVAYPSVPGAKKPASGTKGYNKIDFMKGVNAVRTKIGSPVESLVASDGMDDLRESYSDDRWAQLSSAADTDRLVAQVITSLEEKNSVLYKKILDWGSGTCCLDQIMKNGIVSLDRDHGMLKEGRNKVKGARCVQANMRYAPFRSGSFDVVTSIYALQYNAQGHMDRRDVEEILLETNRVLTERGYAIFALPNQATSERDFTSFRDKFLPDYGFNVLFADFVSGGNLDPVRNTYQKEFEGAYIVLAQKGENRTELAPGGGGIIYSPVFAAAAGGSKNICMDASPPRGRDKEKKPSNVFMTKSGMQLDKVIKSL